MTSVVHRYCAAISREKVSTEKIPPPLTLLVCYSPDSANITKYISIFMLKLYRYQDSISSIIYNIINNIINIIIIV